MSFEEVAGLEKIKKQLIAGVRNNKLSHSLLFVEPEGNGGLPFALAFATYLLCSNPNDNDACDQCSSCHKMRKLIHPDVHFTYPVISTGSGKPSLSVDFINQWREAVLNNPYQTYMDWMKSLDAENKQGNITMAECHEIIKHLSLKSYEGGKKIQIIWLPEYLGKNGNALLKIIEEPTENTFFLMITQHMEMILNTILSRSQIFLLPPLSKIQVEKYLSSAFEIDPGKLTAIVNLSEGNLSEAISKLNHDLVDYNEQLFNWLSMCINADIEGIYKWVNEFARNGREILKDFLQYAISVLRKVIYQNFDIEHFSGNDDYESKVIILLSGISSHEILTGFYEMFNKAHYHIGRNANQKIIFFDLSLQINLIFSK